MQGHVLAHAGLQESGEAHSENERASGKRSGWRESLTLRHSGTEAGRVRPEAGARATSQRLWGNPRTHAETFQTEVADGKRIECFSPVFNETLLSNSHMLVSVHL